MDNFDDLMKLFMTNSSMGSKRKRVVLNNGQRKDVIFETAKETVLTPTGMPESVITNESPILSDGSSSSGVSLCQKCQGLVRIQSLHRCPCGRTVCVNRGCGKVWGGQWFCSFRCFILYKLKLLRKF